MPVESHLTDEQLIERYFDWANADEQATLHLFRCSACARRLESITARLEEDYADERDATDRYFTEARLDAQREQVLARLAAPREARVLAFPASRQAVAMERAPARKPSRVAAAAAALLLVAGGLTGWRLVHDQPPQIDRTDARFSVSNVTRRAADERLLSEVDMSLVSSRTDALQALDAITPMEGR